MAIDKKSFKKNFPNLSKELELGKSKVEISSVRTDPDAAEKALSDKFRHYDPTVVDFIRRCDTEAQAETIIEYLEKRGDLKPISVKTQLRTVASFFSRNGLPLNLKRGDWESTQQQQVIQRWG